MQKKIKHIIKYGGYLFALIPMTKGVFQLFKSGIVMNALNNGLFLISLGIIILATTIYFVRIQKKISDHDLTLKFRKLSEGGIISTQKIFTEHFSNKEQRRLLKIGEVTIEMLTYKSPYQTGSN